MWKAEKLFLNSCLKKHIAKQGYTHSQIAEGICDKYMISRLIHGYTCKDKTYHKLLDKLGYDYSFDEDIIEIERLSSLLLTNLQTHNTKAIQKILMNISTICDIKPTHIYFVEVREYLNILKHHYMQETSIIYNTLDFSTLKYFPISFQIVTAHSTCENLLFNANFKELKDFYTKYCEKISDNMYLEYFKMCILQGEKNNTDAHIIYKKYKTQMIEEQDLHNMLRYYLLIAQTEIRKHPTRAIEALHRCETLSSEYALKTNYQAFIEYTYMILYIREQVYDKAYKHALQAYKDYPHTKNLFFPYILLLAITLNTTIEIKPIDNNNTYNNLCIHLYTLYKEEKPLEMLSYINKHFPKPSYENPCYETTIHILRKIVSRLAKENRRYKSCVHFYNKCQKYNPNYYI